MYNKNLRKESWYMASEILNAIKEAEIKAKQMKEEAAEEAKRLIKSAKDNGEMFVEAVIKESELLAKKIISDADKKADEVIGEENTKFSESNKILLEGAEKRISVAAEFILNNLADI